MTEPVREIIPRHFDNDDVKKLFDQFSKGIDETVNFGSHVLKWYLDNANGGDEQIPIILSIRHFLDLIDSISILVKNSSVDPAKLILRGALETYFGVEYMLQTDSHNRCMAFLVWHTHKNLKFYKKLDHTSTDSKQLESILNKDKSINVTGVPHFAGISQAIQNLEKLLQRPEYQKAEVEFQKLKKTGLKNPPWYQFFNGPKNVQGLAENLKLNALYEILYRNWSGTIHGTEIIQGRLNRTSGDSVEMVQIRYPKDAQSVTGWALTLSIKMFQVIIDKRLPKKKDNLKKWYGNIRNFYQKVNGKEPLLKIE